MTRVKTLIHLHTDYSYDSDISLEALARFVAAENIGCVAVTDHDTIEGALRFSEMTEATVIVGEEVTTRDGHLIGLFLQDRVPPGMSARETANAIRLQGGLVLLPHPFVRAFSCGLRDVSWETSDLIDAVEVNNAQNLVRRPDRLAERFADQLGLIKYVGADSHMATSIAPCYQMMSRFSDPSSFLQSLGQAEMVRGRHPLSYFAAVGLRLVRYHAGLSLAGGFGANYKGTAPRLSDPSLAGVR